MYGEKSGQSVAGEISSHFHFSVFVRSHLPFLTGDDIHPSTARMEGQGEEMFFHGVWPSVYGGV